MSFLLRPFQRRTTLKSTKKTRQSRRASCSDVNPMPAPSMLIDDSLVRHDDDGDDIEDTIVTQDASSSTSYGGDIMTKSHSGRQVRRHTTSSKQKKPWPRRTSLGSSNQLGKGKDHQRSKRGGNNDKFVSDVNELVEIEDFLRKMTASSQGQQLMKDHIKRRASVAGHYHV